MLGRNISVIALAAIFSINAFAPPERQLEVTFERFTPRVFQGVTIEQAMALAIQHPAGVAYYRLMTNVAPGQMAAPIRADVERINVVTRLRELSNALQRTPANRIYWENLFLLWSSYIPDNEGADVGTIRQLAIDLQNLDRSGAWNYAQLRQKVHNFPSASLVDELDLELKTAERALAALGDPPAQGQPVPEERVTANRRVNWLRELLALERQFWFGRPLPPETVEQILAVFGWKEKAGDFAFRASDKPFRRAMQLLALREFLRNQVGVDGRSIAQMMELDRPLTPAEIQTILTVTMFDRRLALEIGRLLSRLTPEELQEGPTEKLRFVARLLSLDYLASDRRVAELDLMAGDIAGYASDIQRNLGQPISDLQARFSAMGGHLATVLPEVPEGGNQRVGRQNLGTPERLGLLADGEMRQSILFNIAAIAQAALRAHHERLELVLDGKDAGRMTFTEVLREPTQPVVGKVVIAEKEEDLVLATRYIQGGENVVLVKLMGYDIELAPVSFLFTVDSTLNQASHMAMRAESARIPHFNVLDHRSPLLDYLLKKKSQEVSLAIATGKPRRLVVTAGEGSGGGTGQPKIKIEGAFDDNYSEPTRIRDLVSTENRLRARISGGKGRGLALLLAAAEGDEAEILGIPDGIQIPYGFFLEWFTELGIKDKWERALKSAPSNVIWTEVIRTIREEAIPLKLLDKLINKYLDNGRALDLGWFSRSNSTSEDGAFNAAGVNLTVPDVRTRERLEKALKDVFMSAYLPSARVWWHRVYENPDKVRSTVLLMQTVPNTHASVAIISADGQRLSVDSLPGIGENVVGGSGIAERLLYEGDADPLLVQPAWATELKVWARPSTADRTIEKRALMFYGAVLNPTQRTAARKILLTARKVADRDPELRGKHLDVELAWEGDRPRVVQVRPAPAPPPARPKVARELTVSATAPKPAGPIRDLSTEVVLESAMDELAETAPFLDSTTYKVGLAVNLARTFLGERANERIAALQTRVAARAAQAIEQAESGAITAEEAIRRVNACLLMQRQFLGNNETPRFDWDSDQGKRVIAALVKYASKASTKPGDEATLLLNTCQLLFSGEPRFSFSHPWRRQFLRDLPVKALANVLTIFPTFPNDDLRDYFLELAGEMISGDTTRSQASFARLNALGGAIHRAERDDVMSAGVDWVKSHLGISFATRTLNREYAEVRARVLARAKCPLEFSDNEDEEKTPAETTFAALIAKHDSLAAIVQLPFRFVSGVIEDEGKKKKDERSAQRLVGALVSLNESIADTATMAKLRARATAIMNESGVRIEARLWWDATTFEITVIGNRETIRFNANANIHHELLLGLDLISPNVAALPAEEHEHASYDSFNPKILPTAKEVAKNYTKVALAWVNFRRLYLYPIKFSQSDDNDGIRKEWHRYLMNIMREALARTDSPTLEEWRLLLDLYLHLIEDRRTAYQEIWEAHDGDLVSPELMARFRRLILEKTPAGLSDSLEAHQETTVAGGAATNGMSPTTVNVTRVSVVHRVDGRPDTVVCTLTISDNLSSANQDVSLTISGRTVPIGSISPDGKAIGEHTTFDALNTAFGGKLSGALQSGHDPGCAARVANSILKGAGDGSFPE